MRRVNSKGFARRIFHLAATRMKTSLLGIKAIARREGTILHVYKDSKGLLTAGVGHLLEGDELKTYPLHTKITQAQCDAWLAADLEECEEVVNGIGVKLKPNEFDALVSLAFNIGARAFARSTVAKRIKAGDKQGAAQAILWWKKPPEIQGRRRTEYNQFLTPYKPLAAPSRSTPEQSDSNLDTATNTLANENPTTSGPSANIAVEKEEPLGFWATLWKKFTGASVAVGGINGLTDTAEKAQTFGLSAEFWERLFYIAAIGIGFWILSEVVRWFYTSWQRRKRTETIAALNSTPTNRVAIVPPELLHQYEREGWEIARRNL
jgi:GH24 family phage-related lysozyme (muramidase)